MLKEYNITSRKNILNIDESSVRVSCLIKEDIIILADVKELYTASPKNRKSLIIIKTIIINKREPLPPFIITLGKRIIKN